MRIGGLAVRVRDFEGDGLCSGARGLERIGNHKGNGLTDVVNVRHALDRRFVCRALCRVAQQLFILKNRVNALHLTG